MSCDSDTGMETPVLLVDGIISNDLFHSSPHINQMLHQIIHILHFSMVDSLLNYAQDFHSQMLNSMSIYGGRSKISHPWNSLQIRGTQNLD